MYDLISEIKNEFVNLFSENDLLQKFHNDCLAILDSYKIKYKIKNNEVIILIKESADSDLPLVKNFITKGKLSAYKKKKLKDLSFSLPPKLGNLNLEDIRNATYIVT